MASQKLLLTSVLFTACLVICYCRPMVDTSDIVKDIKDIENILNENDANDDDDDDSNNEVDEPGSGDTTIKEATKSNNTKEVHNNETKVEGAAGENANHSNSESKSSESAKKAHIGIGQRLTSEQKDDTEPPNPHAVDSSNAYTQSALPKEESEKISNDNGTATASKEEKEKEEAYKPAEEKPGNDKAKQESPNANKLKEKEDKDKDIKETSKEQREKMETKMKEEKSEKRTNKNVNTELKIATEESSKDNNDDDDEAESKFKSDSLIPAEIPSTRDSKFTPDDDIRDVPSAIETGYQTGSAKAQVIHEDAEESVQKDEDKVKMFFISPYKAEDSGEDIETGSVRQILTYPATSGHGAHHGHQWGPSHIWNSDYPYYAYGYSWGCGSNNDHDSLKKSNVKGHSKKKSNVHGKSKDNKSKKSKKSKTKNEWICRDYMLVPAINRGPVAQANEEDDDTQRGEVRQNVFSNDIACDDSDQNCKQRQVIGSMAGGSMFGDGMGGLGMGFPGVPGIHAGLSGYNEMGGLGDHHCGYGGHHCGGGYGSYGPVNHFFNAGDHGISSFWGERHTIPPYDSGKYSVTEASVKKSINPDMYEKLGYTENTSPIEGAYVVPSGNQAYESYGSEEVSHNGAENAGWNRKGAGYHPGVELAGEWDRSFPGDEGSPLNGGGYEGGITDNFYGPEHPSSYISSIPASAKAEIHGKLGLEGKISINGIHKNFAFKSKIKKHKGKKHKGVSKGVTRQDIAMPDEQAMMEVTKQRQLIGSLGASTLFSDNVGGMGLGHPGVPQMSSGISGIPGEYGGTGGYAKGWGGDGLGMHPHGYGHFGDGGGFGGDMGYGRSSTAKTSNQGYHTSRSSEEPAQRRTIIFQEDDVNGNQVASHPLSPQYIESGSIQVPAQNSDTSSALEVATHLPIHQSLLATKTSIGEEARPVEEIEDNGDAYIRTKTISPEEEDANINLIKRKYGGTSASAVKEKMPLMIKGKGIAEEIAPANVKDIQDKTLVTTEEDKTMADVDDNKELVGLEDGGKSISGLDDDKTVVAEEEGKEIDEGKVIAGAAEEDENIGLYKSKPIDDGGIDNSNEKIAESEGKAMITADKVQDKDIEADQLSLRRMKATLKEDIDDAARAIKANSKPKKKKTPKYIEKEENAEKEKQRKNTAEKDRALIKQAMAEEAATDKELLKQATAEEEVMNHSKDKALMKQIAEEDENIAKEKSFRKKNTKKKVEEDTDEAKDKALLKEVAEAVEGDNPAKEKSSRKVEAEENEKAEVDKIAEEENSKALIRLNEETAEGEGKNTLPEEDRGVGAATENSRVDSESSDNSVISPKMSNLLNKVKPSTPQHVHVGVGTGNVKVEVETSKSVIAKQPWKEVNAKKMSEIAKMVHDVSDSLKRTNKKLAAYKSRKAVDNNKRQITPAFTPVVSEPAAVPDIRYPVPAADRYPLGAGYIWPSSNYGHQLGGPFAWSKSDTPKNSKKSSKSVKKSHKGEKKHSIKRKKQRRSTNSTVEKAGTKRQFLAHPYEHSSEGSYQSYHGAGLEQQQQDQQPGPDSSALLPMAGHSPMQGLMPSMVPEPQQAMFNPNAFTPYGTDLRGMDYPTASKKSDVPNHKLTKSRKKNISWD